MSGQKGKIMISLIIQAAAAYWFFWHANLGNEVHYEGWPIVTE